MKVFSRPAWMSVLVALAACGSKTAAPLVPPQMPEIPPDAHDALIAQLEAMRPFVATDAGVFKCEGYTAAASAALKELVAKTETARLERGALLPATLTAWQSEHQAVLGKLINEVSSPLRKAGSCQVVAEEHAWARVAEAIVAVGEPLEIPATIVKRRTAIENLLVQATKVTAADQCGAFSEAMVSSFSALDGDLKAMPRIEQFVDNLVWEKIDEETLKNDARVAGMMKICGAEEGDAPK
jgi:hypothetical protein